MLDNIHHGHKISAIVTEMRAGRKIEAIKQWRILYGVGLKEAKDAVEALCSAFIPNVAFSPAPAAQYVVFSRYGADDHEYSRYTADDRADADTFAARVCNSRDEVIVTQVVAQSVTTRSMKAV
jgi:hypothetical protein